MKTLNKNGKLIYLTENDSSVHPTLVLLFLCFAKNQKTPLALKVRCFI